MPDNARYKKLDFIDYFEAMGSFLRGVLYRPDLYGERLCVLRYCLWRLPPCWDR
jgi:hypothetical protein